MSGVLSSAQIECCVMYCIQSAGLHQVCNVMLCEKYNVGLHHDEARLTLWKWAFSLVPTVICDCVGLTSEIEITGDLHYPWLHLQVPSQDSLEEEEDEKIATRFQHVIQALRNGSGAENREQQYSISEYSTQEGQAAYLSASHYRILL